MTLEDIAGMEKQMTLDDDEAPIAKAPEKRVRVPLPAPS
jgi:hypothetical protein